MTSTRLHGVIKALTPPVLLSMRRRWFGWKWLRGDYADWDTALRASGGYDDAAVFAAVLAAARAVREGNQRSERDGVLVADQPEPNWPLLGSLLHRALVRGGGTFHVLDYGGALGSVWWQHREWLAAIPGLRWTVVEQPHVVEAGRREFSVGPLRFHETLDAARSIEGSPDVVLLSSVLAYLREPDALLEQLRRLEVPQIIIDRTGFVLSGRRRLVVQHVPPHIYRGSYPAWIFDQTLLDPLARDYDCEARWPAIDRFDPTVDFRGMSFVRRESPSK